jgi:lactate 2-monooxygenase
MGMNLKFDGQFGDYQNEIYLNGLSGALPTMPMTFQELEARTQAVLSPSVLSYVAGGAGDGSTQRANVSAFQQWGLVQRMMVGATRRDLSVDLFGMRQATRPRSHPNGRADGGLHLKRGSAGAGRRRVRRTPGFFSLYTPTDRALAESLVHRAAVAGFKGIVVTLDTWVTGWRPCDLGASNFPQLRGHCLANYTCDPLFRARLAKAPEDDIQATVREWARIFGNPLTWDDLPWLWSITDLPLILKGICHPEDVRRARDGGVDGIYCSNHGGRQANGGLAALDALPAVVEAADGLPVLFDSGIRSGADLIKALALGATAVGVGRPYAYGLALEGTDGIIHVLRSLLAEADLLMAVDGYPSLKDLRVDSAMRRISSPPAQPVPALEEQRNQKSR